MQSKEFRNFFQTLIYQRFFWLYLSYAELKHQFTKDAVNAF